MQTPGACRELAEEHRKTRVSVLVESAIQAAEWAGSEIGVFLDLNSGMNRTGMEADDVDEMIRVARLAGANFRGLHWYDGHVSMIDPEQRRELAFTGYDVLMKIVAGFEAAGRGN